MDTAASVLETTSGISAARRILAGQPKKNGDEYSSAYVHRIWTGLQNINNSRNTQLTVSLANRLTSHQLVRQVFDGLVVTTTGWVRGQASYTERCNTPFQGLAADGAKLACWGLFLRGFQVVAFIHDEFVIEVPANADLDALTREIDSICCEAMEQHPDNAQDPIRFRNLLGQLESSLGQRYDADQVRETLKPFKQLSRDRNFWNHRTDGLAIFYSPGTFEIVELQRTVQELLVVADSFHTKPLVRILQSADRYQILCLSRHEAKLYEGNRDVMAQVELSDVTSTISDVLADERSPATQNVGTYGKRSGEGGTAAHHGHGPRTDAKDADVLKFFRAVDRGILEHHSRPSGLPLMLVSLAESQVEFRRISDNPFLLADRITIDPESLSEDDLREQAWKNIEPFYLARLEELMEKFSLAQSRRPGSGDLSDVAKAAVSDKVATLLVEADLVIPGVLDRNTGAVSSSVPTNSHVDDMLDDLAELVIARGGEVIIVLKDRMPTDSGVAAIYRF